MEHMPLLSLLTAMPLIGIGVLWGLTRGSDSAQAERRVRWITLGASLATLAFMIVVACLFDSRREGMQFVEEAAWLPSLHIVYRRGIDGLSLVFLLLTCGLTPLAILAGFAIKERLCAFMSLLLALEAMLIGVFSTTDLVLFAFFFESVLVPLFFVIGRWGGQRRVYAAMKFFLMTFGGSVFMLVGLFALVTYAGTADMVALRAIPLPRSLALGVWAAFFVSFAVKTPLWPFHTWLPHAHSEAPTAGSALLAGVLLKLGGYGFIRVGLQILPTATETFAPFVVALGVVGVLYASWIALAQTDMKRLIAYTSVAHMGICMVGLFAGTPIALDGAVFLMLSHGLVSAGLFLAAGVLYDRMHTRDLARFGGVARVMPRYATLFMLLMLSALAVPGSSGFVGLFLTLLGAFGPEPVASVLVVVGTVLEAAVMLRLYRLIFAGTPRDKAIAALPDLTVRETAMLVPLVLVIFWLGVQPTAARRLYQTGLVPFTEPAIEKESAR
jgi:NADH-quinone oxidoreductase subunit M